uniref:Potassium channel domain-containing protein n=1 Tax=Plectus sambesii TaxID=2011161 RepID=A0A914UW29_9BILA
MAFVRSFAPLTPSGQASSQPPSGAARVVAPCSGRRGTSETDRPITADSLDANAMVANPVSAPIGHGNQTSSVLLRGFLEAVATAVPRRLAGGGSSAEQWELTDLLDQRNHLSAGPGLGVDKPYDPDISPASDGRGPYHDLLTVTDGNTTVHDASETKDAVSDLPLEEDEGFKKYAKLILPHVGLVALTVMYTLIGASVFYSIERPNEHATKRAQLDVIYERQDDFLELMWTLAHERSVDQSDWKLTGREQMQNISDELFKAFEKVFLTATEVRRNDTIEIWSFSTAIFFAVTVVTTIGYGNPVPVTTQGRLICIFFALFGIPLTLVTIADIGKFFSEHLIWLYGHYLRLKHRIKRRMGKGTHDKLPAEHVCEHCQHQGISQHMDLVEEKRIPATLVLAILVLYTALGGVGFGDLMPRRDSYMYIILLYIILGLAITTMCIDLVGVQYIRKIHYFGRKIQDARSALAVVGGKVVLVSELYANLMQKRAKQGSRDAFIIENLYISKHIIPFIPTDIRRIKYIDQGADSLSTSTSSMELHSCRFCHSRFSMSHAGQPSGL